jgi:small subunit ribosomal protein S3
MIERKITGDKLKTFLVNQFLEKEMSGVPVDKIELENSPVGERITIYTSVPGLVIGREGSNIKKLTRLLKEKFNFENPQIKIGEIRNPNLSASIIAKTIANNLSNFGSQKFKLTGFKAMTSIMDAGALGCEIRLSGKLPSARAKSWRFAKGYIKKTGYVSDFLVDKAIDHVTLKTGVVGIKVMIMLPDTPLPDKIVYSESPKAQKAEELKVEMPKRGDTQKTEEKKEVEEKKESTSKKIEKVSPTNKESKKDKKSEVDEK